MYGKLLLEKVTSLLGLIHPKPPFANVTEETHLALPLGFQRLAFSAPLVQREATCACSDSMVRSSYISVSWKWLLTDSQSCLWDQIWQPFLLP